MIGQLIKRESKAVWSGGLKSGKGEMTVGKNRFKGEFTFSSRFEEGKETNPEELLAAAHAGCFSMEFAGQLEKDGHKPARVETTADVGMDKSNQGYEIKTVLLSTTVAVEGIDRDRFQELAQNAKDKCPVSRLFKGAEITVKAEMV